MIYDPKHDSCRVYQKLGPLFSALASAILFGAGTPLAKLLLGEIQPVALAGLLYAGVFLGLGAYYGFVGCRRIRRHSSKASRETPLQRRDLPWLAGAILAGGIVAPICLMLGLNHVSGFTGSLLLNFEAAATALIAVLLFKENAGKCIWAALVLMTAGGILLSWNSGGGRLEASGPLLILAAMASWGLDNNLTRQISDKNPVQIAMAKGLFSGASSLALAIALGQGFAFGLPVVGGLAVGALCYGLSLVLFIKALKGLGASRTGALFSLAPFAGAIVSVLFLGDRVKPAMAGAGLLMAAAAALVVREKHVHTHHHDCLTHTHAHVHPDLDHDHPHGSASRAPHAHAHVHEETNHVHGHWPDSGHRHGH